MCSSARESWSAQSLSLVGLGRLGSGQECRCSKYALYRNRTVSGTFGMSNQERPDLLQAIKHLRGRRVVKDSRRPLQRLGRTALAWRDGKAKGPLRDWSGPFVLERELVAVGAAAA